MDDLRSRRGKAVSEQENSSEEASLAESPVEGAKDRRLTLGELTEAAGVSVRTVRYYIAEGLLPPPEGAGPASAYSGGHLARLRLIQCMKDAYLPLKEIRRRLAGLDDEAVRRALDREEATSTMEAAEDWDASLSGARDYLALMESRQPYRAATLPLDGSFEAPPVSAPSAAPHGPQPARSKPPRPTGVFPGQAPRHTEEAGEPRLWHRLRLGDEAELVISDRVYSRHKDRIDWLVRWARKVFG